MDNPKADLIIIQPTPFCNINCRYCYLPYRSSNKRITLSTVSRIAQAFFASPFVPEAPDKATFLWHAGEPLTVPISFYKEAFQVINDANIGRKEVIQSIQTNGTLINQKWCDFFKENNVHVGVSIDGTKEIHNANRVDRKGKGTFEQTIRGIRLLQENDIPVRIIMVVTNYALDKALELWDFFIANGILDIAFNPEEVEGCNRESSLYSEEFISKYQDFLSKIAALRARDSSINVRVRELDYFIKSIRYGSGEIRSTLNNPMYIISFDCDGNVSTFCPELLTVEHERYGKFTFGNVMDNSFSLEGIFENNNFKIIHSEIERGKRLCQESCHYFFMCGGGNPSNKLSENGSFDSTETTYCRLAIKATCDAVLAHLEQMLGVA